jgi:hypothetical protein
MVYKKSIVVALLAVATFGSTLVGCYKYAVVKPEGGAEITRPVLFSGDIIPIFDKSCNMSGCHSTGGKAPDLSPQRAYQALINGGYINTSSPEKSELYLWMTGKKGTPMPLSGPNQQYNSLVLAWIKQGALNN